MNDKNYQSKDDFARARSKGRVQELMSTLQWKNSELLSFYEVTKLLKPRLETYRGIMPIPVKQIIGSEGRYHDFTLAFYPKKEMLRSRWQSIDNAHYNSVTLPPISVYKLNSCYFVRDGNHRVSVAKMQGVEFIDAEVVELDSQIKLEPGMTQRQIRKRVVDYERERFIEEYHLDRFMDMNLLRFSAPGMYPEIINHILVHKYYINQGQKAEIEFDVAAKSWYDEVFLPIVLEVRHEGIMQAFPGKTSGDLYLWMVRHWDDLKHDSKSNVSIEKAALDYKARFAKGFFKRWLKWLHEVLARR
jgi:hypothetical protein